VGKTALLDYLAEHASGCRVARVAGVESEMELAFAGVHQLCAPMLDHLERLPGPQRELYQLLRQPGPIRERTFEITFQDPGVQAYAFTFG
jgi:Thioredoxin like C-terminal domain